MNDVTDIKLRDAMSIIATLAWRERSISHRDMTPDKMQRLRWGIQTASFALFEVADCDDNSLYGDMDNILKTALFFKLSSDGMLLLMHMIDKGILTDASIGLSVDDHSIPMAHIRFNFPSAHDLELDEANHQELMRTTLLIFIRMGVRDEWRSMRDTLTSRATSYLAHERQQPPTNPTIHEIVNRLH